MFAFLISTNPVVTYKSREMTISVEGTDSVFCVKYVHEHFAGGTVTMEDDGSGCLFAYSIQGNLIDVDTTISAVGTNNVALIASGTFLKIIECKIVFNGGADLKLSIGFYISGAVDLINATV